MGWICESCGTENDFSVTRCQACDKVAGRAFIRREQAQARREFRRYQIQVKRREAQERSEYTNLRRFNRALCGGMAALALCGMIFAVAPVLSSPEALRASAEYAISAFRSNVSVMCKTAAVQLTALPERHAAQTDALAGVLSQRVQSRSIQIESVAECAARLERTAAENSVSLEPLALAGSRVSSRLAQTSKRLDIMRELTLLRLNRLRACAETIDSPSDFWHLVERVFRRFLYE